MEIPPVTQISVEQNISDLGTRVSIDELITVEQMDSSEVLISETDDEETLATKQLTLAGPTTFNLVELIKKSAINLILPFINGIMLGFGEIAAHEIGFRWGWTGARVQPVRRMEKRSQSNFL